MVEEEDTLHLCNDEVRELMGRVPPPPSERLMHLAQTWTGIVPERLRDGMPLKSNKLIWLIKMLLQ